MNEQATSESYDIIRRPIITEKATMASEHGIIAFEVAIKSTKKQIKDAIENLFNVKVEAINTLIVKGKVKRFRGKIGKRRDLKKGIKDLSIFLLLRNFSRTLILRFIILKPINKKTMPRSIRGANSIIKLKIDV